MCRHTHRHTHTRARRKLGTTQTRAAERLYLSTSEEAKDKPRTHSTTVSDETLPVTPGLQQNLSFFPRDHSGSFQSKTTKFHIPLRDRCFLPPRRHHRADAATVDHPAPTPPPNFKATWRRQAGSFLVTVKQRWRRAVVTSARSTCRPRPHCTRGCTCGPAALRICGRLDYSGELQS